ncbi:hypothetical protein FB639_002031 [Coemansia asiatica]|nr:hypothetical protein FB639_002031 [Coemansia asiatica]
MGTSLFAAAPRKLCENPFDIIKKEIGAENTDIENEVVVVGASGDLEDSDLEDPSALQDHYIFGRDLDEASDGECEYDPSMYRISIKPIDPNSQQEHVLEPSLSQLTVVAAESLSIDLDPKQSVVDRTECGIKSNLNELKKKPNTASGLSKLKSAEKSHQSAVLSFARPPESLSMRTHVSVTTEVPLNSLDRLSDDQFFFCLTSLCPGTDRSAPISRIADSLTYWEIIGAKPQDDSLPSTKSSTAATVSGSSMATGAQIQQSLVSLYYLQKEAPLLYPYIYLSMRDFTIIFKMMVCSTAADDSGKEKYRRVAVISQSYLGLRRILRNENVDFSMPLAPKLRSWNELQTPGDKVQKAMSIDKYHLQSTGVDKTWRSAILIMDEDNVEGLFRHLRTAALDSAHLFSTHAFVNGTMRKSTIRFSSALSYEDRNKNSNTDSSIAEQQQMEQKKARHLHKLDVKGVILPNAWHSILMALTELPEIAEKGFIVAAKERSETIHLNMLVSKQGSSVAGKRNVLFDQGLFNFS